MAFQCKQVFYIKDPSVGYGQEPLSFVLIGKRMHSASSAKNEESTLHISETPSISIQPPTVNEENESDIVHDTRNNHDEGIVLEVVLT